MPISARAGIPPAGDPVFDALLDRTLAPEDAPAALRPLAEAFAAAQAADARSTPGAQAGALAAFRAAGGRGRPSRARHRGPGTRRLAAARLMTVRVAAGAAVAAVALAGAAAAAVTQKLPVISQTTAHEVTSAPRSPAAQPAGSVSSRAAALPGDSAVGLCTAWAHMHGSGNARKSAALRRLEAAAGGPSRVSAFCATVTDPGPGPSGRRAAKPPGWPPASRSHSGTRPPTSPSPHGSRPGSRPAPTWPTASPTATHSPAPAPAPSQSGGTGGQTISPTPGAPAS